MSDAFDSVSLKSNASFSGLSPLISLSPIFSAPLLFNQLPSSSFTPRPSPTQTHLLNCLSVSHAALLLPLRQLSPGRSGSLRRRPCQCPRMCWGWRRRVFLTTSTFKAPDGLRWGWHFPTERCAREAHTHPLPTPTALLSSERKAALAEPGAGGY